MLQICDHPGCTTLTLGSLCLAHELPVPPLRFPRGRPHPGGGRAALTDGVRLESLAPPGSDKVRPARTVSLGGGT